MSKMLRVGTRIKVSSLRHPSTPRISVRGQTGATNSVRHIGPPIYERVSDFTKVGASPPRIQMCESGGCFPSHGATSPAMPPISTLMA